MSICKGWALPQISSMYTYICQKSKDFKVVFSTVDSRYYSNINKEKRIRFLISGVSGFIGEYKFYRNKWKADYVRTWKCL